MSLGTGIGTALVLQREIYQGRAGGAGEGGHMTINFRGPLCGCGKRGCIEMYASGIAIARRARTLLRRGSGGRSPMLKMEMAHALIQLEQAKHLKSIACALDRLVILVRRT